MATLTIFLNVRAAAKKLLKDGVSPTQNKKVEKVTAKLNATNTFEAIAREWYHKKSTGWTTAYALEVLRRLERDIFPVLGPMPIRTITPPQVLAAVQVIEARGAGETARRALQKCGEIFRGSSKNLFPCKIQIIIP